MKKIIMKLSKIFLKNFYLKLILYLNLFKNITLYSIIIIMFKNYLMKEEVKKTKGFTQKTMQLIKKGKQFISLKDVKDIAKELDKHADKKYVIRARNEYRDNLTIRDMHGNYYDEDEPDYYNVRGYVKNKYENFFMIQIVLVK